MSRENLLDIRAQDTKCSQTGNATGMLGTEIALCSCKAQMISLTSLSPSPLMASWTNMAAPVMALHNTSVQSPTFISWSLKSLWQFKDWKSLIGSLSASRLTDWSANRLVQSALNRRQGQVITIGCGPEEVLWEGGLVDRISYSGTSPVPSANPSHWDKAQ